MNTGTKCVLALAAAMALPSITSAATFTDTFEGPASATSPNWTVNRTTNDTEVTFGYDYNADGIPAAPRSAGTTKGLKLRANIDGAASTTTDSITMTPTGITNTGNYSVTFDAWMNTVGPFPGGGAGSTYFLGAGVGYNGTTNNRMVAGTSTVRGTATSSGTWFAQAGDTGYGSTVSARDYVAFRNGSTTFIENSDAGETGVYFATDNDPGTADAQDHTNARYQALFPGNAPIPGAQSSADSTRQTGTVASGTPTFRWVRWDVVVENGVATWKLDGTNVAQIAASETNPLDGLASLMYFDPNLSAPAFPQFTFGVVDNFQVVPEPTALAAIGLCGLALLRRRRASV